MPETDRERLLQAWRTTRWIRLSPFGDAKRSPHLSEFPKENRLATPFMRRKPIRER